MYTYRDMSKLQDAEEPILKDNKDRFVIKPIKFKNVWKAYKKHQATFWTAEEIDLAQDSYDWKHRLGDKERHFISHVLAFFAASDGIVLENLAVNFMKEVQIPEARCFYGFQIAMENIHSETYSDLIDTYITDADEKDRLFHAIDNVPTIKRKADWALKWIGNLSDTFYDQMPDCAQNDLRKNFANLSEETKSWMTRQKRPFAERLIAFACIEGIFFSGSFCAIFWLKDKDGSGNCLMPGLIQSNDLISKDEGLHQDFAVLLYSMIVNRLPEETVHTIVKDAVDIEKEFITEAIPCALLNMNSDLMKQYIEFVADRLLLQLGYNKIWGSKQPFEFMDMLGSEGKSHFFERRVTEYQRAGVLSKTGRVISLDRQDF